MDIPTIYMHSAYKTISFFALYNYSQLSCRIILHSRDSADEDSVIYEYLLFMNIH